MKRNFLGHILGSFLPITLLLCGWFALPQSSGATPLLKLDFKALPDIFISGSTIDLPLYLVENRDATESSRFSGYPSSPPFTVTGPFPLASIESDLTSTQSTFISFTPVSGFDSNSNNIYFTEHEIKFYLQSTNGVPVDVDNSGIIGRTEILIGTLRVLVGLPIPDDDGIGEKDPDAVFWTDTSSLTNHARNASLYLGPNGSDNQGTLFLGGISAGTYKINAAPNKDPGNFIVSPLKSYKSDSGTLYPNFTCHGTAVGATCNGKAELYVSKKVGAKMVKTVYGKCAMPVTTSPHDTYCIMKLTTAAKGIIKNQKRLKATLSVTSVDFAGASKIDVTIK